MSLEACPHCHEQVHKTEDGCGTEKCMARRAFIRQAVIQFAHSVAMSPGSHATELDCWDCAVALWNAKPEGC